MQSSGISFNDAFQSKKKLLHLYTITAKILHINRSFVNGGVGGSGGHKRSVQQSLLFSPGKLLLAFCSAQISVK